MLRNHRKKFLVGGAALVAVYGVAKHIVLQLHIAV